jgi:DNA polymerase V
MSLFNVVEDHQSPYLSLDDRFVNNRHSTFFFCAKSEAMSPLIMMGDTLIVDRSLPVLPNMVVLASINGEIICRRLVKGSTQNKRGHLLIADNKKFAAIDIENIEDGTIWGVVRGVVRELLS